METLRREVSPIRMRNYGRILQDMVQYAMTVENELERQALTLYIAQCMRQKNQVWNREQETGLNRVKEDILRLSNGQLNCDFPEMDELLSRSLQGQMAGKKKRK